MVTFPLAGWLVFLEIAVLRESPHLYEGRNRPYVVLAISCIYGGEFPTKIIIQTIQKIFAHFFLKYKNARGGICVRTSSKSIIYIYTVYTAFLSEDFQNMFDFERKITTKVFYFEASQIYR